jgi:hypothetical protein
VNAAQDESLVWPSAAILLWRSAHEGIACA